LSSPREREIFAIEGAVGDAPSAVWVYTTSRNTVDAPGVKEVTIALNSRVGPPGVLSDGTCGRRAEENAEASR